MSYECLKNLQPQPFFHWFGKISEIPRPSYKEQKLICFLEEFAAERNLRSETDKAGNVYMVAPATAGYESQPSILLQAHMDVVSVKDEEKDFNFETDPLPLYADGDKLTADGTILGADNGVGLATMLAIANDKTIPHPELELLFTAAEEVGLVGIRNFDMTKIRSRRMLNMDSGYSHEVCVTSAGKISSEIKKEFSLVSVAEGAVCLTVSVAGVTGGHAGTVAKLGRACAPSVLAALLKDIPLQLVHFKAQGPAVFRKCTATICVPASKESAIKTHLKNTFEELKAKYSATDPDMTLQIAAGEKAMQALSVDDSVKVIDTLYAHRTQGRCPDKEGRITASNVIIGAELENGKFTFRSLVRSMNDENMQSIFDELQSTMPIPMTEIDRYSGWPERKDSKFRALFNSVHREKFGTDLTIERVLGGMEVGPILGAIPDMDAVGYAPSSFGAHSTGEYLKISDVPAYWEVLLEVLARKE